MLMVLVALLLCATPVAADELWIRNEGGVEVTLYGDNLDVQYDGIYAFNPENGKLAAVDVKDGWIVVVGDIEGYDITLACNQSFEDVNPEVSYVFEYNGTRFSFDPTTSTKAEQIAALDELTALGFGPPPAPPSEPIVTAETPTAKSSITQDYDSGPSIAEVTAARIPEYDWTGEDYWYWT